jgi:tetratricopeptide (TPR) repeat protein
MRLPILALTLLPAFAFAAGSDDPTPPAPTPTVTECAQGLVWDLATQSCLTPEASTNDDNALLDDIRALAYAGQYQAALDLLDQLGDPTSPLALTYYGFTHRKAGRADLGLQYYQAAIAADPANHLARSYMGQGYVSAGDLVLAQVQLTEIRMRGGAGTWAETSLATAIDTGKTLSY